MTENYRDDYGQSGGEQPSNSEVEQSYESSESSESIQNSKDQNNKSDKSFVEDDDQQSEQQAEERGQMMQVIEQPHPDKPNQIRITSPFLTKYQKARVIGVRAVQISKNSPLYLNADSKSLMMWDPLTIAEKELAQQKIPFIIRRYLPDGSFEDWKISQLKSLD